MASKINVALVEDGVEIAVSEKDYDPWSEFQHIKIGKKIYTYDLGKSSSQKVVFSRCTDAKTIEFQTLEDFQ